MNCYCSNPGITCKLGLVPNIKFRISNSKFQVSSFKLRIANNLFCIFPVFFKLPNLSTKTRHHDDNYLETLNIYDSVDLI